MAKCFPPPFLPVTAEFTQHVQKAAVANRQRRIMVMCSATVVDDLQKVLSCKLYCPIILLCVIQRPGVDPKSHCVNNICTIDAPMTDKYHPTALKDSIDTCIMSHTSRRLPSSTVGNNRQASNVWSRCRLLRAVHMLCRRSIQIGIGRSVSSPAVILDDRLLMSTSPCSLILCSTSAALHAAS